MTAAQRRKYSRQAAQMYKDIELQFTKPIYRAIRKQVSSFFSDTEDLNLVQLRVQVSLFNEDLMKAITRLHKTAGMMNARQVRSELRLEEKKSFGTNEDLLQFILEYLRTNGLEFATSINETTKQVVLKMILRGVEDGLDYRQIARTLETGEGAKLLKYQALRIVRTESVRASNAGRVAAANNAPFETTKEWVSTEDKRTRDTHRALQGIIREMDEDFKENLAQPGDPRAPARETICCRCVLAIVGKRNAKGRLIMKSPNPLVVVEA